jgi:hypothetical protein
MMTAAKLISELDQKPRRTIRVVLFANEEFGTSGFQGLRRSAAGRSGPARAGIRSGLSAPDRVAPI